MVQVQLRMFLGIDPGASGGLAALCEEGAVAVPMPATMGDVWDWVNGWRPGTTCKPVAVIEQVGGYVGKGDGEKGGGAANGSSMFKFGASCGSLIMALTAARVPFESVIPTTWQKGLGIAPRKKKGKGGPGETKTAWKNRLKAKAQQLFPGVKVVNDTADALLIAEYCRRKHLGLLGK